MNRIALVAVALLLSFAPPASAAAPDVPGQISYQGVLLDTQGEPRTGSVDLVLRIWDAPTGGTLVYKQEFPGVALNAGVFTVKLGPTGSASDAPANPLTTSLADALAGDAGVTAPERFLEVTVGVEGALARTQILTAPYALRAATADSAATAEVAATAAVANNVTAINGLDAGVLNQLFQFGNSDNSGPPNADPAEGTADVDGDGAMNFIDADNDGDSIDDQTETVNGSDINLVTPTLSSLSPMTVVAGVSVPVTLNGLHFDPGVTVFLDGAPIAASDVTSTSAVIQPAAPHPIGSFPVSVQNPNGQASLAKTLTFAAQAAAGQGLNFLFTRHPTVSISVRGPAQVVVGDDEDYAVDDDVPGDVTTDQLVSFDLMPDPSGGGAPSQIAVTWGPDGRLTGLRCAPTGSGCQVQVVRDADEDLVLDGGPGDQVLLGPSYTSTALRLWGPSLAFDANGRVVVGYVLVDDAGATLQPTVLHDVDGNGAFAPGAPETVVIETLATTPSPGSLGKLAIDPAGHVAFAYAVAQGAGVTLRIAYDRNGDHDFADTVAGTPETFTPFGTVANQSRPCGGIAFDGAGRLTALFSEPSASGVRWLRDVNGDGDFADPVDATVFVGGHTSGCDIASHPTGGLAVVHGGGTGQAELLIDRNGDGDFSDATETQIVGPISSSSARLGVTFNSAGRAFVAGHAAASVFVDPL